MALAVGVGLALFWYRHPKADVKASARPADASVPSAPDTAAAPVTASPSASLATNESGPAASNSSDKTPSLPPEPETTASREQTLETIQDLAVTYDAASVPALARFLSNRDAEIRAAARDGLIQLGERAAIPYLQEAARKAAPEEAQALREAAEFLALPTWTERRAALKAQKKAAP